MLSRILTSGASMLAAVGVAVAPTAAGQTVRSLGPGRVIVPTPSMDLGYVTPPMFPLADGGTLFLDSIDKRLLRAGGATRALQQIGSDGEGPGQFRHPSGLWTRNDSLVLTDQALRRASVFGIHRSWDRGASAWPRHSAGWPCDRLRRSASHAGSGSRRAGPRDPAPSG